MSVITAGCQVTLGIAKQGNVLTKFSLGSCLTKQGTPTCEILPSGCPLHGDVLAHGLALVTPLRVGAVGELVLAGQVVRPFLCLRRDVLVVSQVAHSVSAAVVVVVLDALVGELLVRHGDAVGCDVIEGLAGVCCHVGSPGRLLTRRAHLK